MYIIQKLFKGSIIDRDGDNDYGLPGHPNPTKVN
jgi:hypothetical protein